MERETAEVMTHTKTACVFLTKNLRTVRDYIMVIYSATVSQCTLTRINVKVNDSSPHVSHQSGRVDAFGIPVLAKSWFYACHQCQRVLCHTHVFPLHFLDFYVANCGWILYGPRYCYSQWHTWRIG